MLIRVVKMKFEQERLSDFLEHFESIKWQVAQFPGCSGMQLLQDLNDPCLLFTY